MECKPVFLGLAVVVLCLHYGQAVSPTPPPLTTPCIQIACKCPYGTIWTTDAKGCRRCSCKPRPVECPLLKCSPCPRDLYQKDENGCQTCTCEFRIPIPVCPAIACLPGSCSKYGFELDSNGCNTCRCKQCPSVSCPVRDTPCPNGYATDSRGCQSCDCKPSDCERVLCMVNNCPFGFAKDSRGCQIGCECAVRSQDCPQIECSPFIRCPNGRETSPNGCPTCRCKTTCTPPVCPAVVCPGGLGFEYDTDANGCKTNCRCRTSSPVCPSFRCRLYCRLPERIRSRISDPCGCTC